MRLRAVSRIGTFEPQGKPLMHAETMLLIDDGKPELMKCNFVLKQRVGAHDHVRLTRRNSRSRLTLLLAR